MYGPSFLSVALAPGSVAHAGSLPLPLVHNTAAGEPRNVKKFKPRCKESLSWLE